MAPLSKPLGQFPIGVLGRRRVEELLPERPPVDVRTLPFAHLIIETGTNEDWIDVLRYDYTDEVDEQLDLRGIHFEMHLRRSSVDREIIVGLSTIDRSLLIGPPPNWGCLFFYVPEEVMKTKFPGEYVGDVRASKGSLTQVCLTVDLTLKLGITRNLEK